MFDQLHDNECAQNVTKKPHTQRQRPNCDLHHIQRCQQCHRLGEGLQKALQTALRPERRCFNQDNTHNCECHGNIDVLGRRLHAEAKHTDHICHAQIDQNGAQIWHIAFSGLAHVANKKVRHPCDGSLHKRLPLSRNQFQIPGQHQHQHHDDRHNKPGHGHGFTNVNWPEQRHIKRALPEDLVLQLFL